MGALRFFLLLSLVLSSPVQAQWWSFIWASPKSSSSSSPSSSPPSTSPSITSTDPPATHVGITEWLGNQDEVTEGTSQTEGSATARTLSLDASTSGHSTAEPGTQTLQDYASGVSKARAQYKPLKHWKSGESLLGC